MLWKVSRINKLINLRCFSYICQVCIKKKVSHCSEHVNVFIFLYCIEIKNIAICVVLYIFYLVSNLKNSSSKRRQISYCYVFVNVTQAARYVYAIMNDSTQGRVCVRACSAQAHVNSTTRNDVEEVPECNLDPHIDVFPPLSICCPFVLLYASPLRLRISFKSPLPLRFQVVYTRENYK